VDRRAADHLRSGHLWVYASDVVSVTLPKPEETLLPVADQRGIFLGTALYSPQSQIALRLVSRDALDHAAWLKLFAARLRAAVARRKPMLDAANDACRLCFSEADELPGLIVDKYGDLVVLQFLAKGLLTEGVSETCVRVLREELAPAAIFERPDPRIRELEGLPAPSPEPLWLADSAHPVAATEFHLNGLVFHYDANAGQKTGAFLDQRANYAAAQQWAQRLGAASPGSRGRALDVCCYQGGFALHLAQVCRQVTGIDTSRASLEVAERNLQANRARISGDVDWIEADAFEILRDWSQTGEKFDAIVLDPPAFAKTKRAVEGALRGTFARSKCSVPAACSSPAPARITLPGPISNPLWPRPPPTPRVACASSSAVAPLSTIRSSSICPKPNTSNAWCLKSSNAGSTGASQIQERGCRCTQRCGARFRETRPYGCYRFSTCFP
jgi:23S rRNA (cytosine1962-C5)-methyltransferase